MDLIIKKQKAYWGGNEHPCTQGMHGLTHNKTEGDGKTPIGIFPFREIFYRQDRIILNKTQLPTRIITPTCGWCDDPVSDFYNQYITKPFEPSHEDLWMEKHLYNIVIVVGYNDSPTIKNKGSAIFIHVAHPKFEGTRGCIGLPEDFLIQIANEADEQSMLVIEED